MPNQHALLSASGAHRWLNCPPSALIEANLPEQTSPAAEEGTTAHALAEWKLNTWLKHGMNPKPVSKHVNPQMEDYTDDYLDYVKTATKQLTGKIKPYVSIETRVDFSQYVKDGFGTCDCVIVCEPVMHIIDLKYGQGVKVDALNNPQLRLYALGALNLFNPIFDITQVRMTIFQPRLNHVDTDTISVKNLQEWGKTYVKPRAKQAINGEGEYHAGSWCRFCKIKATCRTRAEENLNIAQKEFTTKTAPQLTDKEISEALKIIPELKQWAADIEKYALNSALNGTHYDGYKLVEGRSLRRISDEKAAIKALEKAGYTNIYQTKLLGITALEKMLGKKQFKQTLNGLIEKPAGKPALVTIDDPRTELTPQGAVDDFTKINK